MDALKLSNGTQLTALGRSAGSNLTGGNHCTYIGYGSAGSAVSVEYELVIGCEATTGKGGKTGFINANGEGGDGAMYQGDNTSTWTSTSDERIKKNIVDSTIGLAEINQIQVRNFEYRLPEEVDPELPQSAAITKEGVQIGVIAQEVIEILPDIVKQETTGCYSVNPDNITWHLVKAVQELTARIEELENN